MAISKANPVSVTAFNQSYFCWKGWEPRTFGELRPAASKYFSAELRRANASIRPGMRVLEIGFGNGPFLTYASAKGAVVSGTELNPELVERAIAKGFNAHLTPDLRPFADDSFDLIVAIDLIEHIPARMVLRLLEEIKRVLRPGGLFVARFPNADSPFGLVNQNGDITHVNAIGTEKARFYAGQIGAEIVVLAGEARPIPAGNWKHTLQRIVAWPVKKLTNLLVSTIFLPGYRGDFSAVNLSLVMKMPSYHQQENAHVQ